MRALLALICLICWIVGIALLVSWAAWIGHMALTRQWGLAVLSAVACIAVGLSRLAERGCLTESHTPANTDEPRKATPGI